MIAPADYPAIVFLLIIMAAFIVTIFMAFYERWRSK